MRGSSFMVGEIPTGKLGQLGNPIYIATILDGAGIAPKLVEYKILNVYQSFTLLVSTNSPLKTADMIFVTSSTSSASVKHFGF